MPVYNYFALLCTIYFIISVSSVQNVDIVISNSLDDESTLNNVSAENTFIQDKLIHGMQETVEIKLYYECMCPDCRNFDTTQFEPVVEKLSQYLDIHPFPYGNAETYERDGHYEFKCQHGPAECYGNKLHACALDALHNVTQAVIFNSCMMDYSQKDRGSDDAAADVCGISLNVDPEPIKKCAKDDKGTQLLKHYGDESKKANFTYVPYILVNGDLNDGSDFFKAICTAFANKPPPCEQ